MMSGINEIGVARICTTCAMDMDVHFVMRCVGNVEKGGCERCGRHTTTMIYFYTLRGHEYDRRGIEMIFEEE